MEQGTTPKHFLSLSIPTRADFFLINVLHCTLLLKICHQSELDPQLPALLILSGIFFLALFMCSEDVSFTTLSPDYFVSRQMVPPVTGNIRRSLVHT